LKVVKTVRVPVHYALTKRKLWILDKLTARLTYGVWLWSKRFDEHNPKGTYADRARFYEPVKTEARLPGHVVQCCYDTAKWMWSSYRALHRAWRWQVAEAKRNGEWKWLRKLLKREPQKPFSRGMTRKVPIWFDSQLGSIEKSRIKLCPYVARVSTLRRGVKLTVPLNPAKYPLDLLSKGDLKSFQLVKRDGRYYAHIKLEYSIPDQPILAVRGIDLGVRRSVATVALTSKPQKRGFRTIRDGVKRARLRALMCRIAELQWAQKWEPLKRIRHKRLHVAEYYDRLKAKRVADLSNGMLVGVGYPKGLKYRSAYRGNGKPHLRSLLTGWAYGRAIRFIQEECVERGIPVRVVDERWTSMTCPRCGSRNTDRPTQSLFHCWNCELWYNADYVGALNIGSRFLPLATTRGATVGLAQAGDELGAEPNEPRSRKEDTLLTQPCQQG
jgi:putative transposase